jgi:hypothetical protein
VVIGAPFFVFFGWLSDKVGRKPVLMLGLLLATLLYFPMFKALSHYANPQIDPPAARHRSWCCRPAGLHLPVRPGGQGAFRQPVRQGQDLPGQAGPALQLGAPPAATCR